MLCSEWKWHKCTVVAFTYTAHRVACERTLCNEMLGCAFGNSAWAWHEHHNQIAKHSLEWCEEIERDADTYWNFCVVAWFLSLSLIVSASQSMVRLFFCPRARLNMLRMRSLHVARAWFAHNKVRIRASARLKKTAKHRFSGEGRMAGWRVATTI